MLIAVAVVVLLIGAVAAFVITRHSGHTDAGGGGSHSAASTGSTPTSGRSASVSPGPVLRTGVASTPTVSWDHFAAFSRLLGTRNNDSTAAFDRGACRLSAPGSADTDRGIRDEVTCTYSGSAIQTTVARFASAARVQDYLADRVDEDGFSELVWTTSGRPRGLTLLSPVDGTGASSLSTSICGLPTYVVTVGAPDRSKVGTQQLHDDTWNRATFPDSTPPACDSTFRAAGSSTVTATTGPAKAVLPMSAGVVQTLAREGDGSLTIVQVATPTGLDAIAVGQKGTVSFWTEVANTLQRVGESTYPYSSTLGAPKATAFGAVLTGMTNATFVVRGTFSSDGSGNAVAYTTGSKGWGAIKAQSDGDLHPSGQGVDVGAIGLGQDFGLTGGRLVTYDCSPKLAVYRCSGNDRIIKYWTWRTSKFEQTGSAGRSS